MSFLSIPPNKEHGRNDRPRGLASRILTSPRVFEIRDEIGDGRPNDPDDLQRLERGLAWAGYRPEASELVDTLKRFQADHGLEVDGWMRPGGPTARALDDTVAPKVMAWRAQHPEPAATSSRDGEQVAQARDVGMPHLSGPLIIGTGLTLQQMRQQMERPQPLDWLDAGTASPRREITEPLPPIPPSRPDGEKPDHKEEILPVPQEIPILRGRPINDVLKTDPLVFEIVSEELRKAFEAPLESHRGGEKAQKGNRRAARICEEELKAWGSDRGFEHVGGAYTAKGKYLKEQYIKNRKTGRLGSSNPDLTFEDGTSPGLQKRKLQINGGHTLKDGETPVASEREQLARLAENARDAIVKFMPKLRTDKPNPDWERRVRKVCREALTEMYGPPPGPSDK